MTASLSLSEQIAAELAHAAVLEARVRAVLNPLDPSAPAVAPTDAVAADAPLGGSILSSLDALMEIHLCP